jgi:hypothetical protein
VDLTEITTEGIRLSCTKAEFDKLDPAEETHFEEVWDHPAYEPDQVWCTTDGHLRLGARRRSAGTPR